METPKPTAEPVALPSPSRGKPSAQSKPSTRHLPTAAQTKKEKLAGIRKNTTRNKPASPPRGTTAKPRRIIAKFTSPQRGHSCYFQSVIRRFLPLNVEFLFIRL